MSSFSGNGSVHGILSPESADYFGTSDYYDGEANCLGVVNFHSMQVSLAMSMRFIFGDHGLK